jgi:hypothetical protein
MVPTSRARRRAIYTMLCCAVLVNPKLSVARIEESHEQSAIISVRLLLDFDITVVYSDMATAGVSVIRLGRLSLENRYSLAFDACQLSRNTSGYVTNILLRRDRARHRRLRVNPQPCPLNFGLAKKEWGGGATTNKHPRHTRANVSSESRQYGAVFGSRRHGQVAKAYMAVRAVRSVVGVGDVVRRCAQRRGILLVVNRIIRLVVVLLGSVLNAAHVGVELRAE